MTVQDQRLCSQCVGEAFLRGEIEKHGHDGPCSYCASTDKSFSLEEMADAIEAALEEHFYLTPTEPSGLEYAMSKEGEWDWERNGESVADVIGEYAEIAAEPAEDIRRILEERHFDVELARMGEENPFARSAQYAERAVDDSYSQAGWSHFEQSMKTEARYFSRTAEETLRSIFDGIAHLKTHEGRPTIVEAGPGKELAALHRARVFQSNAKLAEALKRPDKELGPPPPSAAVSGRMNAHGIAVFYGAVDPLVALAEVRPPVGCTVMTGRFELIRSVRLLDVEALRSVYVEGSIFDRGFIKRLERGKFLGWLSERISRPIMPDDEPLAILRHKPSLTFSQPRRTHY